MTELGYVPCFFCKKTDARWREVVSCSSCHAEHALCMDCFKKFCGLGIMAHATFNKCAYISSVCPGPELRFALRLMVESPWQIPSSASP